MTPKNVITEYAIVRIIFTKIHNLQISQHNDFVGLDVGGIFTSLI